MKLEFAGSVRWCAAPAFLPAILPLGLRSSNKRDQISPDLTRSSLMEGFVAATTAIDTLPEANEKSTNKHTFVISSGFACTRCGLCCRNVRHHDWYRHLDRGDGVCRHFADATNLCTIYESRPDACRIDVMYERHFAQHVPRAAFDAANHAACRALQAAAATATD